MNRVLLLLGSVIVAQPAIAGVDTGVVVAVTKNTFTIKSEDSGEKMTMGFGPDMGKRHNKYVPKGAPLGAKPEVIKTGMKIQAWYQNEDGRFVCWLAKVVVEQIGPREVDFATMLPKGKETIPECVLRISIRTKAVRNKDGIGMKRGLSFNGGFSPKSIRDEVKKVLSNEGWKVKEADGGKLVVEGSKGDPVLFMKVEAEGLAKSQQPRVTLIDPSK